MKKIDYKIMGRPQLEQLYRQKLGTLHEIGKARNFSITEIPIGLTNLIENLEAFDFLLSVGKR